MKAGTLNKKHQITKPNRSALEVIRSLGQTVIDGDKGAIAVSAKAAAKYIRRTTRPRDL